MSNKARKWRSVIAMVLVVSMLFSIFPVAAFANTDNSATETIKYVSLGDSMTNGYGLSGYDGNTGVEDYGNKSYANQFAADLGAEHAQLAMSAMRAEDLHWLLEVDYNDPAVIGVIETLAANESYYKNYDNIDAFNEKWYSVFTNGDYWTWCELVCDYRFDVAAYCIEGKDGIDDNVDFKISDAYNAYTDIEALQIVAQYYQESVANANIVSLGIGNGNFGVFMFGRIMEAIGFDGNPEEAMIYDIENAIRECDPELQAQLLTLKAEAEVILASKGIVADDGDDSTVSSMEALYNTFMYATISYALNYAGTVEAILQLNPDAEIIQVALMNTIKSNNSIEGEITLGDAMDALIIPLNAYLAALPTVMQTADNSVYNQATFYWAEAPYVECIVDTYEEGNLNNIVRDRFFQSIVKDENDKAGMVWGMLGDMVCDITLDEIKEYEDMDDAQKLAYAASAASSADKAKSISMYLAFEKAIVASKENSVGINAIMGLTDLFVPGADPFGPIMDEFYMKAAVAGVEKQEVVYAFMAQTVKVNLENIINEMLRDFLVGMGYLESDAADIAVNVDVNGNDIKTIVTAENDVAKNNAANVIAKKAIDAVVDTLNPVFRIINSSLNTASDEIVAAAIIDMLNSRIEGGNAEAYISSMLVTMINSETVDQLTTLLVMPDELGNAVSESELSGLLALFARCVIGNGIGSHPSENGHNDLYVAVINAYETGYTAQDETLKNAMEALDALEAFIVEYHPEMIAYAWQVAYENGYTAEALKALNNLEEILDELKAELADDTDVPADVMKQVYDAIADVEEAIEALRKVLNGNARTPEQAMSVVNELCEAVADLVDALALVGQDANEQLLIVVNQAMEDLDAALKQAVADMEVLADELKAAMYEYLEENAPKAMEALKDALYDLAVQTGDDIYCFLYKNPDKVVGFFNEYGDEMLVLMEDYGPYTLAAMGWIAQNYGEDILDFVMDNHEEILEVTAMLLEKHGENAAKLINVYAEYLGWCDEVRDLIADVEGEIEDLKAQLEELNTQLEDLYAQLENLYEELENASEEAKAEIEAAIEQIEALIAEVEAAIEQIEDAIEQLETQLEELEAQLEEAYKAIEAIVEAIEEAVESGIETVEEILEVIEAVVDYAEETIAGVKTAVEAIVEAVEDIVDFTEELIANGIIAAEQVEEILSYIVGVINGVIEELEKGNVEKVIEELRNQLTNGYAELYDMLAALDVVVAEELAAIVDDLEIALAKAEQEFKVAMYNATHGTIFCEAETYSVIPVAGADATVNAADGYVDAVTSEWNLRMVTEGETPDVLFYQVDPQIFVDALLSEEYIPSWEKYITDEKVLAYFNEKKAELKANLVAEYSENVVNILEPMIDRLMFAVVEYAVYNIQALERISAQYDDTLIVAVGMYNPVQGMNITMDGEVIDVAELCQDMIEVTDAYNLLYAVASQGVVFVDVSEADAEKIGNVDLDLYAKLQNIDMSNLTWEEIRELLAAAAVLDEVLGKLENSNYATEDGHAYIAKQILAAITVEHTGNNTECDVCTPKEEVKGMKGDVNLDGRVYTDDAVTLMRHVVGLEEITDPVAIYNADVVCDDRLYTDDAVMIMRYVVGLVDSLN